jgi:hypothetical protein
MTLWLGDREAPVFLADGAHGGLVQLSRLADGAERNCRSRI